MGWTMDRGLYLAASGMLAEQLRQDQIANDLSNSSTSGLQGRAHDAAVVREAAPHQLRHRRRASARRARASRSPTRSPTGPPQPLKDTGEPLDMAINGDGFFAVQTAERHALHAQRRVPVRRAGPPRHRRWATRSSAATTSRSRSAPTARSIRATSTSSCSPTREKVGDNYITGTPGRRRRPGRGLGPRGRPRGLRRRCQPGDGGHDRVDAGLRGRPEGHPHDRRDARQGRVLRRVPLPPKALRPLRRSRYQCSKDSEPPPQACSPSSRSWMPSRTTSPTRTPNGYKRHARRVLGPPVRARRPADHVRQRPARHGLAHRAQRPLLRAGQPAEHRRPAQRRHRGRGLHQGQALRRPPGADARRRPAHRRPGPPRDQLRRLRRSRRSRSRTTSSRARSRSARTAP